MSVAKVTEISCSSSKSFEDAIEKGIERADKTLDKVKGAWVSGRSRGWQGERLPGEPEGYLHPQGLSIMADSSDLLGSLRSIWPIFSTLSFLVPKAPWV